MQGIIKASLLVVLISGNNLKDDFKQYQIGGEMRPLFDERLRKPFTQEDFLVIVKKVQQL